MIINAMALRIWTALFAVFALSGCLPRSSGYFIRIVDADGHDLGAGMPVYGRGIYSMRDTMCARFPDGIVIIKNPNTGKHMRYESPYKCPGESKNTENKR